MTESVGEAIGGLVAAGWTIDAVMDMTFTQIFLACEMLAYHRASMINMLLSPLLGAQDKRYKPGKIDRVSQERKPADDAQKMADNLMATMNMGFAVKTVRGGE